tara:strand:- start:127 stop:393 length:267 start_codon:yes stop_codon:yes gene_type:complete
MKNNYKEDKKTIRDSELGVLPVLKEGGKPTLSATGVLRIPMNAPIRYRYWLHGEHKGEHILSLKEIREELALPQLHAENIRHHGLKTA